MLSFKDTEQKTVVTSDIHLGHQLAEVWQARGYTSPTDHDNSVIDIINKTVGPDDNLISLGDFCLSTPLDKFNEFLSRIECQNIYMIWGNHPNPYYKAIYKPMVKAVIGDSYIDGMEVYPLKYRNVIFIGHYAEVVWNGQMVILSHYPHYVWNHMQHGAWMLCGHSHYGCELTQIHTKYGKILDVGWDGHGMPWSFGALNKTMNNKPIPNVDHHKE